MQRHVTLREDTLHASAGVLQTYRSFLAGFVGETDFNGDTFPLAQRQLLDPLSLTSSRWLQFKGESVKNTVSDQFAILGLPMSKRGAAVSRAVSRERSILRSQSFSRTRTATSPEKTEKHAVTEAETIGVESVVPADVRERTSLALKKKQVLMKFQTTIARVVTDRTPSQVPLIAQVGGAVRKRREACESLRMLVFGRIGNEHEISVKDKNKVFQQHQGTREELRDLHKLWLQLDTDNSGDVDMQEFASFFNRNKEQRLLGWKAQQYLGKTGQARVEDFLKLLYLESSEKDISEMRVIFDEEALFLKAVKEPPVIPLKVKRELLENFKHLDNSKAGFVTFQALVKGNILTEHEARELMAKYDTNNDGNIDENEFLEMLCPHGYRAYEDANFATDSGGAPIMKVRGQRFQGWIQTERT